MIIRSAFTVFWIMLSALAAVAEDWKFIVDETEIRYDTESKDGGDMRSGDVDFYRALLKAHPDVTTLVLNSDGGSLWTGEEMARITLDYGLNTVVDGVCASSCVDLFLAGDTRTMTRGSMIGFHLRHWSASAIESYYEEWAEEEGWDTPFEMGTWIYKDTQAEIFSSLEYITSRGVTAEFAILSKTPRENTWYPLRQELLEAGVLTE